MKTVFLCLLVSILAISCKNGQSAEDYYNAGVAKMQEKSDPNDKSGSVKAALQDFDKAIELNPEYADALERRAVIRRSLNDYAGAMQDAEKMTSINPKNKNAFYFIGQSKLFHQDYAGSIKAYTQALALDTAFAQSYYERGRCEKELNNYDAALKDFNHAISSSNKSDKFYHTFYLSRGELKIAMNDKAGACGDLYVAVSLGDPFAQDLINSHCK